MANLVDIFTQTNSSNTDTQLLNSAIEDLPKDKPSLFDSLLKKTIDNVELNKDNSGIKTTQAQTTITENVQNINNTELKQDINIDLDITKIENNEVINLVDNLTDDNIENDENTLDIKQDKKLEKKDNKSINNTSKISLLDRLILEVKSNNTEKIDLSEHISEDTKSNTLTLDIDDKDFLSSLDEKIDELNNSKNISKDEITIDKKIVINDNKIIELIQKESLVTDVNTNNIDIQSLEVETKEILISNNLEEDLSLEDIDNNQDINNKKIDSKLSLMDQLIQSNSDKKSVDSEIKNITNQSIEIKTQDTQKVEPKLSLMDQLIKESSVKDITTNIDKASDVKVSKDVTSNMFLAEQKNVVNNQLLFNKNEAVKILDNASSLEDIEKSATILDLEASDLEVDQDITKEDLEKLKFNDREIQERKNILNSLLNEKDIRSVDIKNLITNSIEASKALLSNTLTVQDDVVIDVQPSLVNSIESRIIGAKQHLSTMMSDIARQMYENYKPPVTAFRMNLNPTDLGSISILMKQDKISGLSITMSISSLATLELLMDNQNMLRNSLVKTFSDSSNFNLDFTSSQNSNQNQSSNSNSQNKRQKEEMDTQTVLNLKEENRDLEEKTDYM
ncbi:flagellar hook-length control protein FliK [Aliarcobacter lanthieri]|uniref:flagellar hook-length control protein FliK n=1 Tax=Aliarcobacter lanthieri TaxID=1355374 RepID=UPI000478DF76|nr:flagellar hook-length control protein FliK [Aliarcobacter lanthieri]QKF59945.1 flagellar hook-length control protein FliK [Aliarcobacter lanthieri]